VKSDPREKQAAFELRVNGMVVAASMRRKNDDPDECEVVVHDPLVGDFTIHDQFTIDIKKYAGSEAIWSRVSLRHLKSTFLESTSSDLPSIQEILDSEIFQPAEPEDALQPGAKAQKVLVVPQARRAQRILYQAGIPSIVMSFTGRVMPNPEGSLMVPHIRTAVRVLSRQGFKPGPVCYLLLDKNTLNTLRLVQRPVAPTKGEQDDQEL